MTTRSSRSNGHSLAMYVVYDHPADHPHHYVLRRQDVRGGRVSVAKEAVLFSTIEGARNWCKKLGLVSIGRMPQDDPAIAEVWT
jgi:hypothetical protein